MKQKNWNWLYLARKNTRSKDENNIWFFSVTKLRQPTGTTLKWSTHSSHWCSSTQSDSLPTELPWKLENCRKNFHVSNRWSKYLDAAITMTFIQINSSKGQSISSKNFKIFFKSFCFIFLEPLTFVMTTDMTLVSWKWRTWPSNLSEHKSLEYPTTWLNFNFSVNWSLFSFKFELLTSQ